MSTSSAPSNNAAAGAAAGAKAVAIPKPAGEPRPAGAAAYRAPLDRLNRMIRSGDFDVLFTSLKGFRNGVVYGTRVRAPHALVLNLVWSKAPYKSMPRKIFEVTKTHALGLGFSSVIFTVVRALLRSLQGGRSAVWHTTVAGFLVGFLCWGDVASAVHLQMMMYMLSRVICAYYHLIVKKFNVQVPALSFRIYMGVLYSMVMTLLLLHADTLQPSMRQSLEYIFSDSSKYTSWYDVFVVNTIAAS